MANTMDIKSEAMPDLDDLLQCPVCYEIPTGQILQCNEGHHVCSRCKARLDLCPVCRSLFFGTRNYALEELIANVRKLQAFKLGGKMTVTSVSGGSESTASAENSVVGGTLDGSVDEGSNEFVLATTTVRAPSACKGLFRCLCCKNGKAQRLPAARLLNHLRYFHAPELIEGKSEEGAYVQAWQIPTAPGRIVIAVRVADMGIFFLVMEINSDCIYAWVSMAAAPWVALEYTYTITISGNDREAIFTDCVWSVRACEGTLKKRGRCLTVNGSDAYAFIGAPNMSGRLVLRRAPTDSHLHPVQPRAVLRVANRSATDETLHDERATPNAMYSRMFAILNEADGLGSQEGRERNHNQDDNRNYDHGSGQGDGLHTQPTMRTTSNSDRAVRTAPAGGVVPASPVNGQQPPENQHLSRNARRRMRQRLLNALNANQPHVEPMEQPESQERTFNGVRSVEEAATRDERSPMRRPRPVSSQPDVDSGPSASAGSSASAGGHRSRTNKKKRRHRK